MWKWFNLKGQGQGRAKGQIRIYLSQRLHFGSYVSLWKAAPNMTLTLTFDLDLEKFAKVKIFETYQLKKTESVNGEGESQPKCQIH